MSFDGIVSPIGLVVALVALFLVVKVAKTAVKLLLVVVLLLGAYLFFYGGTLT